MVKQMYLNSIDRNVAIMIDAQLQQVFAFLVQNTDISSNPPLFYRPTKLLSLKCKNF